MLALRFWAVSMVLCPQFNGVSWNKNKSKWAVFLRIPGSKTVRSFLDDEDKAAHFVDSIVNTSTSL